MLGACKYAVVIVEGLYDAYLLAALLPEGRRLHYFSRLRNVWEKLWECMYADDSSCYVAYLAGGLSRVEAAARKLLHLVARTLPDPGHSTCLAVIVDSDMDNPAVRLEKYAKNLGVEPVYSERRGSYFAAICRRGQGEPRVCVASWLCSAECWIALLAPGSPITSLERCDKAMRSLCHEIAREYVKEARIGALRDAVKHAGSTLRPALQSLTEGLGNGVHSRRQ